MTIRHCLCLTTFSWLLLCEGLSERMIREQRRCWGWKGVTMPTPSVPQELASVAAVLPRGTATSRGGPQRAPSLHAPPAVWLDLTLLNRTALAQVLEHYALPLEVTTYFQLKFQSPKVIAADRALFLVTFVVTPLA